MAWDRLVETCGVGLSYLYLTLEGFGDTYVMALYWNVRVTIASG